MSGRAQTEAIGVVTVTAVVLLLAFTVGFAVVESMSNAESTAPALGDYRFDADGTAVSVTHAGGDAVPLSDLSLVVRGPNGSTSRPFTAGTLAGGGAVFRPGSTWGYDAFPFPFDRAVELDLLVVHGPSGAVVDRTTVRVGSGSTATPTDSPTATPTASPTDTPTATPTPVPTPPEVRFFEATNHGQKNVRVELRTDERLSDLRVVLYRGDGGRAAKTLTRGQFAESDGGPYTYVATTTVARSGSYRVVLERATNDAGADAGDGQTRRVDVDDDHDDWWNRWWDWWSGDDGGWWDDWWGGDDDGQGDGDDRGDGGWNWWPW